jgi:hypothetical protein
MTPATQFRVRYGAYLFYLSLWLLHASLLYLGGIELLFPALAGMNRTS